VPYSWKLLLNVLKRDFRSGGMKYAVNVRWGGTGLGTAQNRFGEPIVKKEPGPE